MNVDADRRSPPCVLVIFGASGDLTARKLLPALERLSGYGAIPPEVALVGVARTPMTDPEFGDLCRRNVPGPVEPRWKELAATARYVHGGYDDPATYQRLAEVMAECDHRHGTAGNRVYYLATPPRLFGPVAISLGKAGLSEPAGDGFVRAVVEKPFGWDEASARGLYAELSSAFFGGADLPDRPPPRQGDGAEPARPAVRQLDLRADREPDLGGQRADHR
jgi:glucose-6-phosphate 1-dehydrogenase